MMKFINKLSDDDSIISLNYDLIVDNSLMHGKRVADYDINFRSKASSYPDQGFLRTKLYKLHGSLNWLYCPACQAVDLTPHQKGAVYIFDRPRRSACDKCGVRYEPIIITPTFLKRYENVFISQIWIEAEAALEKSDEVVFIGYSLPDADIILRGMFARAFYRNWLRKKTLPKIIVVDFNDSPQNETRTRYEALFGEIEYVHQGFKYYVHTQD